MYNIKYVLITKCSPPQYLFLGGGGVIPRTQRPCTVANASRSSSSARESRYLSYKKYTQTFFNLFQRYIWTKISLSRTVFFQPAHLYFFPLLRPRLEHPTQSYVTIEKGILYRKGHMWLLSCSTIYIKGGLRRGGDLSRTSQPRSQFSTTYTPPPPSHLKVYSSHLNWEPRLVSFDRQ